MGEIYINDQWHTRQLRDASFELAGSTLRVWEVLIPRVQQINPELDRMGSTVAVRKALVPEYVPSNVRNKWNRDEEWVYRFLASLPRLITPGRIDKTIEEKMALVEYFQSTDEALDYLHYGLIRLNHLLESAASTDINVITLTSASYLESRTLRLALYEGDYFARTEKAALNN